MRVSKITLGSFFLALFLGVGILRWSLQTRDDCTRFLAGEPGAPSAQVVVTGSRTVVIPCRVWLPRQPTAVQVLCLLDFLLGVVFLLNVIGDIRIHLQARGHSRFAGMDGE